LEMEKVRIEGEEATAQVKEAIQQELSFRWQTTKDKLKRTHQQKDVKEGIQSYCREWLGGAQGGWMAEVIWTENAPLPDGTEEISRDYHLSFKDWTIIDPHFPLRPPSDFPDLFPPPNSAIEVFVGP
jgi:hypothetical protein